MAKPPKAIQIPDHERQVRFHGQLVVARSTWMMDALNEALGNADPNRLKTQRGKTRDEVDLNIAAARQAGKLCADKGWYPAIPHTNTGNFEHLAPDLDDEFWLQGTLELMRRCDAIVLCPGWELSSGTRGEIAEASRLGLPIYETVHSLPVALRLV